MFKKILISGLSFIGVIAVCIIYERAYSGDVNSTIPIIMFIPSILLVVFCLAVVVCSIVYIIKHKFNMFSVIFIVCSIVVLLINTSKIEDIPYFITGNFVHYNGFVTLGSQKEHGIHYNRAEGQYKIRPGTQRVLRLDNKENIVTNKDVGNISDAENSRGAYEVVYLPNTKYLISFKKIDDSILSNNVKKLDDYSKPINKSKSYTLNTRYDGKDSADVKVTMLSYIPNKYMTEVGKLTGLDYIDSTFDGMAIKVKYDLSNMKSNSENKYIGDIVPNSTGDFVMKDAKGVESGNILENFNGSTSRELYYLENDKKYTYKNGDSKSISGWVIVFPNKDYAKLPISLYIGKNLIYDKDFEKILKFNLPQ
ncbi:hypothetical protein KTC96_02840 [Clostridium estertheticum]|uniref:hypothetical protein n=1 Tax=Clostridium estertheticum TaxID=238834 RepID=UPI001C7E070A|nr:hypothetical protein [Clostridium estertheticum]MBX4260315.1 hypothetical protein [Clostridium estertheticum]WLC70988.1 hypothetical protein KTC96_02840 [Clostridium estertheticum]